MHTYNTKNIKAKKKLKLDFNSRRFMNNVPFILALLVNTLMWVFTVVDPSLIRANAVIAGSWDHSVYMFNFTHAGFFHLFMNMIFCVLFIHDIQRHYNRNVPLQYFVYFGLPLVIGVFMAMVAQNPTVGYSGVAMALAGMATVHKFEGYKAILVQLAVFHVIILLTDANVSVLAHGIGFVVGMVFGTLYDRQRKKRIKNSMQNWRERMGHM